LNESYLESLISLISILVFITLINQIWLGWCSATSQLVWMSVSTLPVCLPASIVHPSTPVPSVYVSVTLSSCLFTRSVCTSAFLHSMSTSILEACSFACLPTPQRGDTRAEQELRGPEPAGAAARLSWQRVPTVGTLWHHRARGKYRGEEEMTVHSYGWGVTDKQDHPTDMQSKNRRMHLVTQSKSQIMSNILIWCDKLFLFFCCHTTITGYKNSHAFYSRVVCVSVCVCVCVCVSWVCVY